MSVQPSADRQAQARYEYSQLHPGESEARGWLEFSIVLLAIAGVLNVIGGIAAAGDSKFFVHNTEYILGGLKSWGWTILLIGVVQLLVAWGITARNQMARWVGIFFLALNAVIQLLMIPAYPFWSLSIFALDLIAMYGLIAYGQKAAQD